MAIKFDDWQDVKVAFEVARLGTLTAAAEALNVHHSTVLRRINSLEKNLDTRLFHRHARGYKVTEIGAKLFATAQTIDTSLEQLHNDIAAADSTLRGSLLLTTVSGFIDVMGDVCEQFQALHPQVQLEVILEQKRLRLDHGQAHIALRAGPKPDEGDYIAQHLAKLTSGLYANKRYIAKHGMPKSLSDLSQHNFVSGVAGYNARVPYFAWADENIPASQIKLRVSETAEATRAIIKGLGIGGLQYDVAAQYSDLIPVLHGELSWPTDVWLVTHHLVHRTAKVQAFAGLLKAHFNKPQTLK
ncbi:LysR family transcriptional regulator [Pseudoalteromonas sp. CR1]|uniref:LysR family transcriptional regulator n=1 Tax=Pseudoalteromonas sp. CR1 TaxID=2861964 RepID=UPI001C605737|nr:LysR family transcriptional regulator [Pseudoalteromonas sp. CR1]MBW4967364.1 LysR family transcriptional regulator [Pseudoalteromonas sp. CR1]